MYEQGFLGTYFTLAARSLDYPNTFVVNYPPGELGYARAVGYDPGNGAYSGVVIYDVAEGDRFPYGIPVEDP